MTKCDDKLIAWNHIRYTFIAFYLKNSYLSTKTCMKFGLYEVELKNEKQATCSWNSDLQYFVSSLKVHKAITHLFFAMHVRSVCQAKITSYSLMHLEENNEKQNCIQYMYAFLDSFIPRICLLFPCLFF